MHVTQYFVSVAAMTATNGVSNGESNNDGHTATPQPEKGSWTIGLINSRYKKNFLFLIHIRLFLIYTLIEDKL